jgi:hypothetical protein
MWLWGKFFEKKICNFSSTQSVKAFEMLTKRKEKRLEDKLQKAKKDFKRYLIYCGSVINRSPLPVTVRKFRILGEVRDADLFFSRMKM